MKLLIPCVYPIIWLLVAILMLLKWIFIDGWFIWATLAGIWLIWYIFKGIRCGFVFINDNNKKKELKTSFYSSLSQQYELSSYNESLNLNQNVSNILSEYFERLVYDNSVIPSFEKIIKEFINNYEVPNSTIKVGDISNNLSSIEGAKIKFKRSGWPNVNTQNHCFSISWKSGAVYFYPFTCILETSDSLDLFDWRDIKVSSTKGETSHYSYLHERVDGGPDRRYRYNPAIPVYFFSALVFEIKGKKVNMIFNGENVAEQFEKLFREYKKVLASTGGVTMTANPVIQNPDPSEAVSGDEYASLFKKTIDERGKNILQERLFLSLLADYKVFKEKRFLRPFLETMTEEGYWSELTEGNPSVDTLHRIKKKFITIHQYPEHEATEAISYIGYGLGITV